MAKAKQDSTKVSEIKGVGASTAKTLKKAGITTAKELAGAKPEELAKLDGIGAATAKKLVAKAATKAVKKPAKKAAKKTTKKARKKTAKPTKKDSAEKAAKAAAEAMQDIIARARDHFRQAPHEHQFYLADGRSLKDLRDLAEALEDMQHQIFHHHVTDDRHDFASWVHEVLQERALAEQLRAAERDPQQHQHVICRHIVRRVW